MPQVVEVEFRQAEAHVVSDLSGVGKIVESVLSAVSSAIGTLYRPTAIRKEGVAAAEVEAYRIARVATAEAQAALIRGSPDLIPASPTVLAVETKTLVPILIAPTDKQRAADRLLHVETKRQDNIEGIVGEGLTYAKKLEAAGASGRQIDDDWMFAFIDYAQNISNADIRRLWAKILSSQATDGSPTISRATLDAMRLLEPSGAALFERIVRIYMLTGMIMAVNETEELAFNPDSIETLNLIDIGFLRRVDTKEASIAHHRGVWLFFSPKKLSNKRKSSTKLRREDIERLDHDEDSGKEIRADRCDLTSRGLELAMILFPRFQDLIAGAHELDAEEIGVSNNGIADVIRDEWAHALSQRNAVLCEAEMQFESFVDGAGDEGRRSSLSFRRYWSTSSRSWQSL